ncbi:MAG TPA: S24 family peptidase [Devosia sp.]|jgi:phage repressor protein C with HTH and peptisase S24 domain|uniref:S24 family peptidase n=1 Tax=Devosia sp. TaxID=1871048 RepID=UPI002DDCEE3F|nr:S24 family peptidase [Devosia sp.]HEV2517966.1 S24 family peptidase [Devosia sp.]
MPEPNQLAVDYIRHVLSLTGLSPTGLALKAGISSTTLTRPLNSAEYKFALTNTTLQKIEAATGIAFLGFAAGYNADPVAPANAPGFAEAPAKRIEGQPVRYVPGEQVVLSGRRNRLPVFSGAMGGDGKLIVSSDFVDHMAMPAALEGVQGAYGLIVDGSSMNPEFWEGDVAWINPHLKPARGRNHVFFHTPPGGEDAEAIIKRLNGWNDREWQLEQWNPAKQFTESRRIWPICHRVVGKYEAP